MTDDERARLAQAYEQVRKDLDAILTPFIRDFTEAAANAGRQIGEAVRASLPQHEEPPASHEG